jgi:Ca2+-binding EF-hand superfamily protein
MTDEEKKQLNNFETSLRHLIYLHDKLRRDYAELQQLLLDKEDDISKLRSEYDKLNQSYIDLKSAMTMSLDGGDVRQTKQRLSKIVREVDKCIAMLNQS